SLKIDNLD
nr:Chain X, LEDGF peptide [Homo sapiens]3AVB_Y Chain Y, LEDGF peptide [Homo sapiens]